MMCLKSCVNAVTHAVYKCSHIPSSLFPQEDVSGAQGQRQRPGPQRHVLGAAGFRGRGQQPVEIRERGVGPRWQTGAPEPQLRLHPPGLPELRSALDESAGLLQQSETLQ